MWDDESFYPKNEVGFPLTVEMKNDLVENISSGNFNQGSSSLIVKYNNPPEILLQNLPGKERVQKLKWIECELDTILGLWHLLIWKNI